MKKYSVNVNGTSYEVEIEEMTGAPAAVTRRQLKEVSLTLDL